MIFRHFVSLQLRCRSPVGGRLGSQGECTPSLGPLVKKGPRERGVHDTPPDDLKTTEEDGASSQIRFRETTPFPPRIIRLFPRKKPFFLPDYPSCIILKTLHSDEDSIIYSTTTTPAVAQECVRLCASLFQQ